MAIPGYPLGRVMIKLWDETISFRSSIGLQSSSSNSKSNSLWPKVASIARLAVDLPPSLAQHAAVHPLIAEVAGEAGLVPSLAGCSHQFSNEDRFAASWTDVCSTPLWLGLVTSGCWRKMIKLGLACLHTLATYLLSRWMNCLARGAFWEQHMLWLCGQPHSGWSCIHYHHPWTTFQLLHQIHSLSAQNFSCK